MLSKTAQVSQAMAQAKNLRNLMIAVVSQASQAVDYISHMRARATVSLSLLLFFLQLKYKKVPVSSVPVCLKSSSIKALWCHRQKPATCAALVSPVPMGECDGV